MRAFRCWLGHKWVPSRTGRWWLCRRCRVSPPACPGCGLEHDPTTPGRLCDPLPVRRASYIGGPNRQGPGRPPPQEPLPVEIDWPRVEKILHRIKAEEQPWQPPVRGRDRP